MQTYYGTDWDLTKNNFGKVDFTGFPLDATIEIDVDTLCLDSIYCHNSFSINRTVTLCGDNTPVNKCAHILYSDFYCFAISK